MALYLIGILLSFVILLSTILLFSDIIDLHFNKNFTTNKEYIDFLWSMLITCSVVWPIAFPIILIVSIGSYIRKYKKDKNNGDNNRNK